MDKSIRALTGILLLAFVGTGCIAQTGEDTEEGLDGAQEVEVGEASDAFASLGYWSTGQTTAGSWGLGSLSGVGFMMGLSGNIGNGGALPAFAAVADSPSQIVWHHNPTGGRALGSWVGTIAPSSGETAIKNFASYGTQVTSDLENKVFGANRRCFITAIRNENASHNAFSAVGDALEILDVANKFQFRSSGRAGGSARCMNVTQVLGGASWAWGTSDKTIDLGADEDGKQCYLTGIGGSFRANDYAKGAYIYIRASDNHWVMKVTANKFGSVECSK
jgi:hypothetical protein